jgi:hypothetical protein
MKVGVIAGKTLKESIREPQIAILFLLFPALLVITYAFAFGSLGRSLAGYLKVAVVNEDGVPDSLSVVDAVRPLAFHGDHAFTVLETTDLATGRALLSERRAAVLLQIPSGFM